MFTRRNQKVISVITVTRRQFMKEKAGLGHFIATRRKIMGLTQEELAEKLGVSKSAIAKWETDGGLPDRDNLKRISETMKVSVDDLHRVIDRSTGSKKLNVNITSDVIATLESYGYKVVRPEDNENNL